MYTLFKKYFLPLYSVFTFSVCVGQAPPVQWNKTYGGNSGEEFGVVIQTRDGGYLSAGSSQSPVSGVKTQPNWDASLTTHDYWIVKSDAFGNVQWNKRFGGNNYEYGTTLLQTTDGGFILGGYSMSPASGDKAAAQIALQDYWLLKLDSAGTKQWENIYGGDGNDYLTSLIQTSDGGFFLGGFSASGISGSKSDTCRGANDYWVVRTDASGNKLWDKTFGGSDNDYARVVQQTIDGGFIIGGYSQSPLSGDKSQTNRGPALTADYWIVKTDENGNKVWDKRYGTSADDLLYGLKQTADGGYILGGSSFGGVSFERSVSNRGGYDYWVLKISPNGTKQWDTRYGGNQTDYLFSLQITADGGFIFAGSSASSNGGDKSETLRGQDDYWIVKTNASGLKQWDKTLGGSDEDFCFSISQTTDGGYILGGKSASPASGEKTQASFGGTDFWIIKLGPDPVLPIELVDFTGEVTNEARIKLKWFTASELNNNFFTVEKMIGDNQFYELARVEGAGNSSQNLYYETYDSEPLTGLNYYRLRQTDYDGTSVTFGTIAVRYSTKKNSVLSLYPNPATDKINFNYSNIGSELCTISITDEKGECVYSERNNSGTAEFYENIPVVNYPAGTYVVTIFSGEETVQATFLVSKN